MAPTVATNAIHQKLSSLKKKLHQDGYRFSLDIESLPLVEKLYNDFVLAKESLKKARAEKTPSTNEVSSSSSTNSGRVDACKSEYVRLLKENNDLHQQLMKMQEDAETSLGDLKVCMKKLERENSDLKFLNNQFAHQMKLLEDETRQKSEKILQLQEQNLPTVIHNPAGKKKNIQFRRQRMEIDSHLPPAVTPTPKIAPDPYTADLLKIADDKITKLKSKIAALNSESENMQNKIASLVKQVQSRDGVIGRLMKTLESESPNDIFILDAKNRSNEETISHLNSQVDFLQQRLNDLENQVEQRRVVWIDDKCDYKNVENNLTNEQEFRKLQRQLEDNQEEINRLNSELVARERELKTNLIMEAEVKHECDGLLLKLQEDKRMLGVKISELNANEKKLVHEIDRLRHQGQRGNIHCKKVTKKISTVTVNPAIKVLEEERNYLGGEVETLNRILSTISQHNRCQRSISPPGRSQMTLSSKSRTNSPANKNFSCSASTCRRHGNDKDGEELRMLKEERDELKMMVGDYDKHFTEIQSSLKVLTKERDHLCALYNQIKEELNERRKLDSEMSKKSSKSMSSVSQSLMKRLEEEKEDALSRVRNLKNERDELLDKIKEMDEMVLEERSNYERSLSELKSALTDSEMSKRNLRTVSENFNGSYEHRLRDQLKEANDETAQHKATANQMKLIADQAEETLKEREVVLMKAHDELRTARNKFDDLERKMETEKSNNNNETDKLKRILERLDREKDDLQMEVDAKTEAKVKLNDALRTKETLTKDLQNAISDSDSVLSKMKDALISKDREVSNLKHRLESLNVELKLVTKTKEGLIKDNKRLQDDILTVTKDNHSVSKELQEALRFKSRLSSQAQEYLNEVQRCQEILNSKDQEKHDILEQYSLLNAEVERLESQNHSLESAVSKLKLDLVSHDAQTRILKEKCDRADRSIQDHISVEHNYNLQLSSLTKNVTSLEESLHKLENVKYTLNIDLSAARDLCHHLESDKGQLERQLAIKSFDNDKLRSLLESSKQEIEMLKNQASSEKQRIQDLEGVLQLNGTKEWQMGMSLQEKQAEIQLLKDRLVLNDAKIDNQSRELSYHRTKLIEMESELEKLKRQLISERFERERAIQLLKQNNLSFPEDSRLGAISPESSRTTEENREKFPVKDDVTSEILMTM